MLSNRHEIERPPLFPKCKHCHMRAISLPTPDDFYEIPGSGFGKPSLSITEFRAGGRLSFVSSNGDTVDRDEGSEILEHDESDRAHIGHTKTVRGLKWAFFAICIQKTRTARSYNGAQ